MNEEIIAKLVGQLTWRVDSSGLLKFQQQMQNASRMMSQLGAQATKLQSQLNLKAKLTTTGNGGFAAMSRKADELQKKLQMSLGVKNTDTTTAKASAELERSQAKQLRREVLLQRARKATFAAELQQSKLINANKREDVSLATAQVRLQQAAAVLSAKQSASEQASLKAQGVAQRNQQSLLAAKARQTRLEQLVQQTAIKTQTLQARHAQTLTGIQKAELALQQARERGQQAQQRFQANQAAAKLRESRQEVASQQRASRFNMQQERFSAWQADRTRRETERSDEGGISVMGVTGALAGITGAVYVATKAFDALAERVKERQTGASESQQFTTALETAGGKKPEDQKYARDRYLEISNKYGMSIDLDNAKDYAKFVQGQIALGRTLQEATQIYEDQSATFRAAALGSEAQKRAAYQLNQIRAKGKPEGSDVNDLFDAVGGPVASAMRQAAADRLNFKGPVADQAGWFKAQVTAGQIKAADFDTGMRNFLVDNQDVLSKQMGSIDAAQTRADNQAYIANNNVNASPELTDAVQENILAHRQLNEAMEPLRKTMLALDIGLTNFSTFLLRFAANRNADGSEKTEDQQMQDRMSTADLPVSTSMVGTGDYSGIDGNTQHQGGPIGELWNWMFNVKKNKPAEDDNSPLGNVPDLPLFPGMQAPLNTENLDKHSRPDWRVLSSLPVFNPVAMQNMQDVMNSSNKFTAESMFRSAEARLAAPGVQAPSIQPPAVTNTVSAGAVVVTNNFEIHPPKEMDSIALGQHISDAASDQVKVEVRQQLQKVLNSYLPKEVK